MQRLKLSNWLAVGVLALAGQCAWAMEAPSVEALLQQEDPAVLTRWGLRYAHGEGVERDVARAVKLFCKAARDNHAPAAYELGVIYMHGRGVVRDDGLAAAWLSRAAAQDTHAARLLRLVSAGEKPVEPRCLLPDGSEYLAPIESVPDPSPELILTWVERLAPEYGLDPALVAAVIRTESNFDPRARSPKDARGLMQLIPATARRFGVEDIWDPVENLRGGLAYLRWLLDHFDGDVELALAGYNAGENAVRRYRGIPPYAETRRYVQRVTRRVALQM
ncbi:MAG: transglycosylase SLT domain-containing protein [Gammaproteobacteria bacterium]|nr:transglycosylase SLT domain-containing protein [Gammaproteobacteria bacterium]